MADKVKGVEIDLVKKRMVELLTHEDCPLFMVFGQNVDGLADYLIAHGVRLEEKQATSDESKRWIPVTERLPEYADGHVLVTDGNQAKISCRNALYKTANGEVRCAQGYGSGMPVTHWMPMPEPPKN